MSIGILNTTLTTPAFYVLLAVTDKTLHGYGIRSQIAADSESQLILPMGTIYPLLDRLAKERLVERIEVFDAPGISCRYHITKLGDDRLRAEIRRMERITNQARYKLGQRLV